MALNDGGVALLASALQGVTTYMQVHTAAAGTSGTDNIATPRLPIFWTSPSAGSWGLASPLRFISGPPSGVAYSVSLWDAESDGTFYGEYVLTSGDLVFNEQGEFLVTALDFNITASDA